MNRLGYTLMALSAIGTTQIASAELRDAADFDAAGFAVTPTLKASTGFDSNITTAPGTAASPELSANVHKLAPTINAKTEFGDFVGLELDTKAEKAVYSGQAFNNYYDYSFGSDLTFRLTNKQSLSVDYSYARGHDPAGSPNATSLVPAIEKFRTNEGGLNYTLGNDKSVARLELGLNAEGRRYRDTGASIKDFDSEGIDAKVFVDVAPKTEVFIQAISAEYDYLNNADTLDNDDTKTYLGVQWQATAKTSGNLKVGKQEKEFTDPANTSKQDQTVWEAGIKWEPKSYSAFNIGLSRELANGNGNDVSRTENAVDRTVASLGWSHSWSDDIKTNIGTSLLNEEFLGAGTVREGIKADTLSFDAGLDFQVERNFTISMSYSYADKNADPANNTAASIDAANAEEYSRNSSVVFGVEIGL